MHLNGRLIQPMIARTHGHADYFWVQHPATHGRSWSHVQGLLVQVSSCTKDRPHSIALHGGCGCGLFSQGSLVKLTKLSHCKL